MKNDLPLPEGPNTNFVFPFAFARRLRVLRDRKISVESAEMIDAHRVEQSERFTDAFFPPAIAVFLHFVPAVNGIAPQLPVGGKSVGRHPGFLRLSAVFVRFEQRFSVFPHFDGIAGNVNGHIAEQFYAEIFGTFS